MMSEPDFEHIARQLLKDLPFEDGATEAEIEIVVTVLRLVWNAGKASMMGGDFQEGGRVAKPTDTIPVMLSPGSRSSLADADQPKSDVRQAPDFEQIARALIEDESWEDAESQRLRAIAEQLRLVWNARGAADIARLEALDVMVSADTILSLDR